MRGAVATAKLKQLALGEHQIGATGDAEIRATFTEEKCGSVNEHLQFPAKARQSLRADGNVTRQRSLPTGSR